MKTLITIGIVILAVAAVILGISIYLQPNSLAGCPSEPNGKGTCQKVDAIVALSGGDTAARAQAAITLYKEGWATELIFSGAAEDKSGPSNAQVMEKQAVAEGVPSNVILLDEDSDDTAQNASNSESIFVKNNIHSIILVTSGYHQRRAYLEFEHMTTDVKILNSPTNDSDWNIWWWLSGRGWWLAGGELVKIVAFYFDGGSS